MRCGRRSGPRSGAGAVAVAILVAAGGLAGAPPEEYVPLEATLPLPSREPARTAELPAGAEKLVFESPELAGISGLREMWDRPVVLKESGRLRQVDKGRFGKAPSAVWNEGAPGAIAFDAVHRSLLVRFPGSANAIAEKLSSGFKIARAELVLTFKDAELWPIGYLEPAGMSFLGDKWVRQKPRWHAVAWALRKPWRADPASGPTYNAAANGRLYWTKYGAQDLKEDRHPKGFGPAEVSAEHPEGRLDVTAALTDEAFGSSPGARLRALEDCGFIVRKQEVYDFAYWEGGYEWATGTGPRGIIVGTPRLEVAFVKGPKTRVEPPAPAELPARGAPTAVLPSREQHASFVERFGFRRPAWMPDWQWARVQELRALGGTREFPPTYEAYLKWLDEILGAAPRRWSGFDAAEKTQEFALYREAMPEPVRDAHRLYWWAWLVPHLDISQMPHAITEAAKGRQFYERTRDWRGNASVYRTYCYNMGTMNFNHWASNGTLLGGWIIGSEKMMADGRHGLEQWPLKTWCWFDGSTQESIDHYYFSISLKDQKCFADFGPTHLDRMMGRSILAKSVDELASCYHPGLRRFIATSTRTGIAYLFVTQDGTKHIVHTLSREGALTDIGNPSIYGGMSPLGHDAEPGMIAQQTLNGPWAPEWAADMVDGKPLPYEMTVSYKQWGAYSETPLWRRAYLGRHYGLASQDVAVGNETVPVMAQWRRSERKVERMHEVGTLLVRPGVNRTEFLDSLYHGTEQRNPNGSVGAQCGPIATLQHRNVAIVLASPNRDLKAEGGRPLPEKITSVQVTAGLYNFEPTPSWEVFVDGEGVRTLPHSAKAAQRITIRDGVSYIALVPIPATDLGRDAEVVISADGVDTEMQGGGKAKEALRVNSYLYRSERPMPAELLGSERLDLACGGFVIELGDASEYGDFKAFQRHVKEARLEVSWNAATKTLEVKYSSGKNVLELGFKPEYRGGRTDGCFPYRRVNGEWPYLPPDMDRDSTLAQQGRSGRLEKNGAVVVTEKGKMAFLQTVPSTGTYAGYNPFPDPVAWSMKAPGGVTVSADGKLGLARVVVRPRDCRVWIDHAMREEDKGKPGMAKRLTISGMRETPLVEYNGVSLGRTASVPLDAAGAR